MKTTTTTNRTYGYCRVSTQKQSIERQIRNISAAYPDAVMYTEKYTGTKVSGRVQFEKLCKIVKQGDVIVFDSVSRMSRNAEEGYALYQKFFDEGIELVFLKEPGINTRTYKDAMDAKLAEVHTGDANADELLNSIMDAIHKYTLNLVRAQIRAAFEVAEKEVKDLSVRTSEGLLTAKLNGKHVGIQKGQKLTTKKSVKVKEQIKKMSRDFAGNMTDVEVMDLVGVARNTYYRYKKELTDEFYAVIEG